MAFDTASPSCILKVILDFWVLPLFMNYQTTITRKGQMTIPKELREALGLKLGNRVILEPDKRGQRVKITPVPSLGSLAGSFRVKNPHNPIAIRKYMEHHYERA